MINFRSWAVCCPLHVWCLRRWITRVQSLSRTARHEQYQGDFAENWDFSYDYTHIHSHTHMVDVITIRYVWEKRHRLTCPLDKEVQVSSFLLQPYPVTNSLPWACTHTHTHMHTALRHRNIIFHCELCFSPFSLSFTSLSPLGSHCDLFTPVVHMLGKKTHTETNQNDLLIKSV